MRLAIMSFAHLHADAYINNLRTIPGVDVIGIADDNAARGRHFAAQFNARQFDSYATLLAEKPDGVVVCSENANHRDLVQMAAEAGVHVLCEKPLATTLNDAQAMLDSCAANSVQLMIAFPMRFSAPTRAIKTLVDSGQLGTLYGCNTTNQGSLPMSHATDNPDFRSWFVDKRLAGGGALMDHIVHVADLLRWYLQAEVVEVFAEANAILYGGQVDVETGGLVMLTFANGTFATIDCSWSKPPYYPTWGGLTMELVGENGLATVNAFSQVITVYSHKAQRPQWAYWGSDANHGMVEEFVAAIQENRPPAVTGYDGYKALEITLAAYRSAESGQPVALPV